MGAIKIFSTKNLTSSTMTGDLDNIRAPLVYQNVVNLKKGHRVGVWVI